MGLAAAQEVLKANGISAVAPTGGELRARLASALTRPAAGRHARGCVNVAARPEPAAPFPVASAPAVHQRARYPAGARGTSSSTSSGTLTAKIATWNLRHFSANTFFGEGAKWTKNEDKLLEMLQKFDLVAIQEIKNDERALCAVCARLEPRGEWRYLSHPAVTQVDGRRLKESAGFLWRADRIACTCLDARGAHRGYVLNESDSSTPAVHFFHRPPFYSCFRFGDLDFVAMTLPAGLLDCAHMMSRRNIFYPR